MEKDERISIKEWIKNFNKGKYDAADRDTQIEAGWYDWFCDDYFLRDETQNLGEKLTRIYLSEKIDADNQYVFFKNNCPMNGSLYSDFRICDMKTGDVVFTITPSSGHTVDKCKGHVWGKENDFEKALFEGSWKEIEEWFVS